jgi:hypothetical protein
MKGAQGGEIVEVTTVGIAGVLSRVVGRRRSGETRRRRQVVLLGAPDRHGRAGAAAARGWAGHDARNARGQGMARRYGGYQDPWPSRG